MQRRSFRDMECSIAQALEIVGEWWTLLIIRDAIIGVTRFDDFQQRLGISRNILANRLDHLVEHGVLERHQYQERPPRHEYRLTTKGRALWPVINTLREWGDRWVTGPEHASVVLVHDTCGHVTNSRLHCGHCGEPLKGADIHLEPGPGLQDQQFLPSATAR